jgi:hypothetical protein
MQFCKLSWIQDSRFWVKLLESRPGFGSKKFFLESWVLNPQEIANLQTFLDSRFTILGETSWIQAWSWIQEVFLRILNLESTKKMQICKLSWIQDSRFWVKLLESRPCFGFKKFFLESWIPKKLQICKLSSQNLEFWILNPKKNANFANFAGFTTRDSRFWEKLPESRPWLNKRYVRGIVVCSGSIKWYINERYKIRYLLSRNIKGVVSDSFTENTRYFNDILKIYIYYRFMARLEYYRYTTGIWNGALEVD